MDSLVTTMSPPRRAAALLDLAVHRGQERLGQVTDIVYDHSRMVFAVRLQAEEDSPTQVVPIRALKFSSPVLRLRDDVQPDP